MRPAPLLRAAYRLAACLLAVLLPGLAAAAEIVDAAQVAAALARGAIVWDVRDAAAYADGHIPGAVNLGEAASQLRDPNREDWVAPERFAAVLGAAGIDPIGREVIVYGRHGDPSAYYVLSGLRYHGARAGRVFHGGLDAWQAAGKAVSKVPTTLPPVALELAPRPGELVWTPEMIERVRAGRTQIVDTRSTAEFAGEDIRAIRGGHIPGALSLPYEQNWVDPQAAFKLASRQSSSREGMALKPAGELRQLYAALDRDQEVVVYCQSGVRASVTATVLRDLGFKDVKVYEPSWLGYAGVLNAPAEREVFVNVGALNGRIGNLQGRVAELEAELARVKAGAAR